MFGARVPCRGIIGKVLPERERITTLPKGQADFGSVAKSFARSKGLVSFRGVPSARMIEVVSNVITTVGFFHGVLTGRYSEALAFRTFFRNVAEYLLKFGNVGERTCGLP